MFSFVGNAQSERRKPVSIWPDIDISFGQNTVINGVVYKCINSGLCYIRVNRTANASSTDLLPKDKVFFIVDDSGSLLIGAHTSYNQKEFNEKTTLISEPTFDESTLKFINSELLKVNPRSKYFAGISKGTVLSPFTDGEFNFIKLN